MTQFVLDPQSHEGDVAAKVVFALERLSHVFRIHWWEENKQLQLSPLQMQILIALRFHPQLDAVSALAAYLELTDPTVSDAVRVLVEKGYAQKREDSADRRRRRITLTPAGADAAEGLSLFANQIRDFVQELPNQADLLAGLLQLMGQLQDNGFIPLQRMCTTCRHFRRTEIASAPYYCQLLERPLAHGDLRVHCPEHETIV